MWNRWKRKLLNLFQEGDHQTKQEKTASFQVDEVRAKMIYQYPKQTSFRFPVIPDNPPNFKNETEYDEINRTEKSLIDAKTTNRNSITQHKVNHMEDVPAFLRRKKLDVTHTSDKSTEITEQAQHTSKLDGASIIQHVQQTNAATQRINERKWNRLHASTNEKKVPVDQSVQRDGEEETEVKIAQEMVQGKTHIEVEEKVIPNHTYVKERTKITNSVTTPKSNQTERATSGLSVLPKKEHDDTKLRQFQTNTYALPNHLLNESVPANEEDELWVNEKKRLLERTLKHFNIRASVVKTTKGPSVTRFEVQPELGVKVSKIKNLSDDIKLNMAAKDIRMEAPIPGKHTIGIEVPNPKPQMVGLKEIIASEQFKNCPSSLSVALGVTIEGEPLITELGKMPHGLIAGATGSGKSVCINTILISLLYKASHEDVKFLLIDPKMVELAPYNGIPHLVAPVITDAKAATQALKWAVKEMDDRYERFVKAGVRDMERFNRKVTEGQLNEEKLPYIIIVIDELADLMMVSPQDVEDAICRIAQKARACGIHLLLATQRPSVDVITGLIKANIPTRIAFSVSSQVDSRTILDVNGAEKLLGKGDMLFIENGSGKNVRLQGPFVSDEEIECVTEYVRQLATPNYLFEQEELLNESSFSEPEDELFYAVIDFIKEQDYISTSLIQRHFRVGYNRAARLIDVLENKGIISAQNGTKPREILLSKAQIEENVLQSNM
ncbi:DNA translocase FtsK [Virgibacillus sp. W0430]|uniref:DNA translocase FtsK n=1 Tax=Virgibacillus sp. W0430 TaxID=3391580 RepID=UPI003F46776D